MYTTSENYKIANLQQDRKFESNITIGTRTLTNDNIISFTIEKSIQQDDTFSIGNAISSCLNLVFLHNDIDTNDKDVVNLQLGLLVNEAYEYISLGIYNIFSIDTNDTTTTLICYDNMNKFDIAYTENSENPTLYSVINRLSELTGVQFGGTLTDYTNYSLSVLENYTCREVLGFVAGVLGSNAIIDRTGKFNFVSIAGKTSQLSVDYDRYYDYTKKNKNYILKKIVNTTDTEELSLGTVEENSSTLQLQNPYINETILQDLYTKLNNLEFLPYSLNFNGDIALDLGDLISITDKKEVTRVHPILSQTITYTGALNTVLVAQGETKVLNETNPTTSEENEVIRVGKKVLQVQKDAGELYVVVYDEENQSSVRLTEKMLEAIADTIQLTANNINLEGLVTANNYFKINLDGSIEAVNGKFTGNILGGTINISDNFKVDQYGRGTFNEQVFCKNLYADYLRCYLGLQIQTTTGAWSTIAKYDESPARIRFGYAAYADGTNVLYDGGDYVRMRAKERLALSCKSWDADYETTYSIHLQYYYNTDGSVVIAFRPALDNNMILGSYSQRWKTIYSVNALNVTSDRNMKENIKYIEPLYSEADTSDITLDDLYNFVKNDLFLANYNYKDSNKNTIGFIAQDLLEVNVNDDKAYNIANTIVEVDEENNLSYDSGAYTNVVAGALKKAIKKIETLENKIQELENRISKLEVE